MPPDEDSPMEEVGAHYVDAVDRLERVIDVQIEILEGIDEKAEHVTRLVGILLGLLLSVLSVAVRSDGVALSVPSAPAAVAFVLGVGGLVASMVVAVVTYLSSRLEVGVNRNVGLLLSDGSYTVTEETYVRRTLGTYGYNVQRNNRVIDENAKRFRRALVALLVGVVYLSLSGVLYLLGSVPVADGPPFVGTSGAWVAVATTTAATALVVRYVLTGRYLTLTAEGGTDD